MVIAVTTPDQIERLKMLRCTAAKLIREGRGVVSNRETVRCTFVVAGWMECRHLPCPARKSSRSGIHKAGDTTPRVVCSFRQFCAMAVVLV